MHSSRMRLDRGSGHLGGGLLTWGVSAETPTGQTTPPPPGSHPLGRPSRQTPPPGSNSNKSQSYFVKDHSIARGRTVPQFEIVE